MEAGGPVWTTVHSMLRLSSTAIRFPWSLTTPEELRDAGLFTKLDLCSAYNLIRIQRDDEWRTPSITPSGHHEYQVMPYRLSNSPSVFQGFMNEVLQEFLHLLIIIYNGYILIYVWNLADHRNHVTQVLQKLQEHQLYLKLEKCKFHRPSINFLGYVIDEFGITMDQGKGTSS